MEHRILKTIYGQHGWCLTDQISRLVRAIRELQPDKPEDGTKGFIAYNVLNKPRMKMKTGRFLVRKLSLQTMLTDAAIQRLASEINATLFPDFGVRIDTGYDIVENYRNEIGGRSCMTGSNADCVGLYAQNTDRFSQLIIEQNGDSARAMVFLLDSGDTMLCRVYATCEYLKDQIREYGKQRGWLSCNSPGIISGLNYTDGEVPYMDRLRQFRIDDGLLTIGNGLHPCDGILDSQSGEIASHGVCCDCGDALTEDSSYTDQDSDVYCEYCYGERYAQCEKCDNEVDRDSMTCVDDACWCEGCRDEHACECEDCGRYFTDMATIGDNEYCQSCADEYPICENCGEWVLTVDSCGYCENCALTYADATPCGAETALLPFQE